MACYMLGDGRMWFPYTDRIVGTARAAPIPAEFGPALSAAASVLTALREGRPIDDDDIAAAHAAVDRALARLRAGTEWEEPGKGGRASSRRAGV